MIAADPQPPNDVEIQTADGIFVKQLYIDKAGTYIPQHSHAYDHLSMLAAGSVLIWKNGEFAGRYTAPCGIVIAARVKHLFQALEDRTILYCIHNIARAGQVEIHEEHQIVGG